MKFIKQGDINMKKKTLIKSISTSMSCLLFLTPPLCSALNTTELNSKKKDIKRKNLDICDYLYNIYVRRCYMRYHDKKYFDELNNGDNPIAYILNMPKPDFTKMDQEAKEFEEWIKKEHAKERELLRKLSKQ